MANFLNKLKLPTATEHRTTMDLSCDHISSADFMQFNVAYTKELVPKEKITVNMETFTRMEPLVVPTFGRARIANRAFFVPFRTVFPAWTEFITDTPKALNNGTTSAIIMDTTPLFSQLNVWDTLIFSTNAQGAKYVEVLDAATYRAADYKGNILNWDEAQTDIDGNLVQNSLSYDYLLGWNGTTPLYTKISQQYPDWVAVGGLPIKLTSEGRQVMKILNSLGYVLNTTLSPSIANYSALPLLCLAKVYSDWFMPSAYSVIDFDYLFNFNETRPRTLSTIDLNLIFGYITRVSYDSDYFVSAWDRPDAPNDSNKLSSDIWIPNVDQISNGLVAGVTYRSQSSTSSGVGAPFTSTNASGTAGGLITQYTLTALKSLTDYMKRHQIAGSRALDRYLSRFGVTLANEKLNRSVYCGTDYIPLQIGDVMSTADTNNSPLGSYAGKGLGYGSNQYEYSTDEYGIFIIVSTIVPSVGYYQGVDRSVTRTSRLQYYTPEFDGLGSEAVGKNELYLPHKAYKFQNQSDYDNQIFGYQPRYASYKCAKDRLTGDKRLNSMSTGQDSWHLMREFNYDSADAVVHSKDFVRGFETSGSTYNNDIKQYNRIFQNIDDNADHFNMIYHMNVTSSVPMSGFYENYHFSETGKDVTMDVNGVKMN